MTTLNRSDTAYAPDTAPRYFRPVQEGSVRALVISVTPTGQGVLGWVDDTAGEFRIAMVESLQECFQDDIVEPAEVRTVWSEAATGRILHAGTMAVIDGELLAWVSHWQDNASALNGKVECFVANDVENPTSWSLRGTLINQNLTIGSGTVGFESRCMGPPTILPSGRWVMPANTWRSYVGSLTDGAGIYTSDDSGATWAVRFNHRSPAGLGGNSGMMATCIAYHPGTGRLVAGRTQESGFNVHTHYSADAGVTWQTAAFAASKGVPNFFFDDTATLYAANDVGTVRRIYSVPDPLDPTTWVDTGAIALTIDALSEQMSGFQSIPLFSSGRLIQVAFTAGDRIASVARGWQIRRVGLA